MRIFVLTFVFLTLNIVIAQAAEPIVLTYGENRATTDQRRINIFRTPCGKPG